MTPMTDDHNDNGADLDAQIDGEVIAHLTQVFPDIHHSVIEQHIRQLGSHDVSAIVDRLLECETAEPLLDSAEMKENDALYQDFTQISLMEMFPSVDYERRQHIINSVDGDFDLALSMMMDMDSDAAASDEVRQLSMMFPLIPDPVLHDVFVENNRSVELVIDHILRSKTSKTSRPQSAKLNMANHIKLHGFKRMFPAASAAIIREILEAHDFAVQPSKDALCSLFTASSPDTVAAPKKHVPESATVSDVGCEFSFETLSELDKLYRGCHTSSESVSMENNCRLYKFLTHQKAQTCWAARQAHSNGQNSFAQSLNEKARNINEKMIPLRERIMVATFIKYNPSASKLRSLDLHEMHVPEARKLLRDCIRRIQAAYPMQIRRLSIIVGIGRHSADTFAPKLRPAVITYLKYLKLEFQANEGEITAYIH
uniref:CUE domain-containing protein n=1 Tax=Spongospora subterranea TaxID=70186 RepID=A0A0H5R8E7_9EUKA|eukprot:CRZ09982.1 hypothetical protein [Spongospora subterranea]